MPRITHSPGATRPSTSTSYLVDESFETAIGRRVTPRPDGCWIFDGKPDEYTMVTSGPKDTTGPRGARELAHRWVYRILVGEIPEGRVLHHRCFNKGCVNPHHLEHMDPSDHTSLHHQLNHEIR